MNPETERFAEWCVVELMGHRRLAGFLTEVEIAVTPVQRWELPAPAVDDQGDEGPF